MLLSELTEDKADGTYVGLRFSKESMEALSKIADKLPNSTSKGEMHVTLIYSKKPISFSKDDCKGKLDPPIEIKPKKFSIFETEGGQKVLVLELDCDEILKRHQFIMDKFGATYDYPEYKPHVSLSYDIGDFDIKKLGDVKDIPNLYANKEYTDDINPNWLKTD